MRSSTTWPSTFPNAQAVISPFIGMPASARAMLAALIAAVLVPASAWRTSTKISMAALGKSSAIITGSKASLETFEISMLLLLGPGRVRSSTEKEAILYL